MIVNLTVTDTLTLTYWFADGTTHPDDNPDAFPSLVAPFDMEDHEQAARVAMPPSYITWCSPEYFTRGPDQSHGSQSLGELQRPWRHESATADRGWDRP